MSKFCELVLSVAVSVFLISLFLAVSGCDDDPCADCGKSERPEFPSGNYDVTETSNIEIGPPTAISLDAESLIFEYQVPDTDARVRVAFTVTLAFSEDE